MCVFWWDTVGNTYTTVDGDDDDDDDDNDNSNNGDNDDENDSKMCAQSLIPSLYMGMYNNTV